MIDTPAPPVVLESTARPVTSTSRLRFAPSPTGFLHVGAARTALYNHLLARRHGAAFILRIEDTDRERHDDSAVAQIISALGWLGIDWDEGPGAPGPDGPYACSARADVYAAAAAHLLSAARAYPCFCSAEQLAADRELAKTEGRAQVYSGRCRNLTEAERAARIAAGAAPALRLLMPSQTIRIQDMVRGEVTFESAQLGDHIIVRPDGTPTYNFANPVDDHAMRISHVLRGEDLLPSTGRQMAVIAALGGQLPSYGHLPMVNGADGRKLSKRHGDCAVEDFQTRGICAEALVNQLALVGWSPEGEEQVMTRAEIQDRFSLGRVHRSAAVFDERKLASLNGDHLRAMPAPLFLERLRDYLRAADAELHDEPRLPELASFIQEKIGRSLEEFPGLARPLLARLGPEDKAAAVLGSADTPRVLAAARECLSELMPFTVPVVEAGLRQLPEALGLSMRKCFAPIRCAVSGRVVSPGLAESIVFLGRDESLARLGAAARASHQP
ncbi:glutamate--tRNA ligase [Miltoncostaea oceani]|uniref:glutamate--tRNA ligase n=1 Tax=Miltoncostaea oceani TaxID=2843216 RepID=UPI001C3E18D4|nr:glutamate--tRNA ligase [Miltoncostaea oceani]